MSARHSHPPSPNPPPQASSFSGWLPAQMCSGTCRLPPGAQRAAQRNGPPAASGMARPHGAAAASGAALGGCDEWRVGSSVARRRQRLTQALRRTGNGANASARQDWEFEVGALSTWACWATGPMFLPSIIFLRKFLRSRLPDSSAAGCRRFFDRPEGRKREGY